MPCQSGGLLLPPVQKAGGFLNLIESYIVHFPLFPILKVNHQSSGLPFDFKGLSHGLKSVHRTLFTSLRSADLFAAYCIGSETHLNADVRWTSAATSANTGGYDYFCEAKMQIDSCCRHHNPTLTLIESGWDFSF